MEPKHYVGDGVYAEFSGYDILLTTENGCCATNRIWLEYSDFYKLAALVAEKLEELKEPK